MINIVGIVIIASGFIAPYVSNGRLPSIVLFWIGGLLFLNKGLLIKPEATWPKWVRIGILTNVAMVAITFATFTLINGVTLGPYGFWLSRIPYWLTAPANTIGQQLFPALETHQPDGSVFIHLGYFRIVVEDFLNVFIFASVFALIGSLRQKRLQLQKS